MSVRAHLVAGGSVMLAESLGDVETVRFKVNAAKQRALTGSAVPDIWLKTADGGEVAYAAVSRLEPEPEKKED